MRSLGVLLLLARNFGVGFGQTTRGFNCVIPSLCLDVVIDPRQGPAQAGPNIVSPMPSNSLCPSGTVQCYSIVCGTPSTPLSTNNGNAAQNSLPWQAYLKDDTRNTYIGGGVLIDQYHVLTAAHKISNLTAPGTSVSVLMGVYNPQTITQPPVETSKVLRAFIHSGYDSKNLKNDVALLRLGTPMTLTASVMTLCLPSAGEGFVPSPSQNCLVSGWGQTGFNTYDAPTTILKQVYVPIVSANECKASFQRQTQGAQIVSTYLDVDSGNELCAGGQVQLDACTQDGGSPLICRSSRTNAYTLAGLVLWGKGCGENGRYGVYLNVPTYLAWIQAAVQCSNSGTAQCAGTSLQSFG